MSKYYLSILKSEKLSNPTLGEDAFILQEYLKYCRQFYDQTYMDFELDLMERAINGDSLLSSTGTVGKLRWPFTNLHAEKGLTGLRLESSYGPRNVDYIRVHNGIDLTYTDHSVCAAASGKVVYVYASNERGKGKVPSRIVIQHDPLPSTGNLGYTVYLHCSGIMVSKNSHVNAGQPIATMDNIGADGAHLHFEVRDQSQTSVDPIPHLDCTAEITKADKEWKQYWEKAIPQSKRLSLHPSHTYERS